MNIPVLLFVYNRVSATRKVLESLKNNNIDLLIVFQDGPKKNDDTDWKIVNELITKIDWCHMEFFVSEKNKGLVTSIVQGLNYSFQKYEASVVIEDDCYLHKDFYKFVKAGLEQYVGDRSVYSITGYRWPIKIPEGYTKSIYTSYRISSWGWGTWKDRWESFSEDYRVLARIKKNPLKDHYLEQYGRDLERMLATNLEDETSWAVFWALNAIENEGKSIAPVKNLVSHIGYGKNSGVHNVMRTVFDMDLYESDFNFEFPDKLTSKYELEGEFHDMIKKYLPLSDDQNQYYRDALNKWIMLKNRHISLTDILLKKGMKSCVLFGVTGETRLMISELSEKVPVKYILTSRGIEKPVNGIEVTNAIRHVQKDMALIVIPGFRVDNVKANWDVSDFGMVIGLRELLELSEK